MHNQLGSEEVARRGELTVSAPPIRQCIRPKVDPKPHQLTEKRYGSGILGRVELLLVMRIVFSRKAFVQLCCDTIASRLRVLPSCVSDKSNFEMKKTYQLDQHFFKGNPDEVLLLPCESRNCSLETSSRHPAGYVLEDWDRIHQVRSRFRGFCQLSHDCFTPLDMWMMQGVHLKIVQNLENPRGKRPPYMNSTIVQRTIHPSCDG